MNTPEEQNDPVWELLNHASKTEAGPFFSRNVVREIRNMEAEAADSADSAGSVGFLAWLRQPVALLGGSIAAIAILAISLAPPNDGTDPGALAEVPEVEEINPAEEFNDLEYLGELMAVIDPNQLDDRAFADLF
ncbi:MAG: hypothetical protein HKN23_10190 [Verrucomicrobiales bacterium]|nr:hypothetical protein [Verrucomicrobiales bacterium]